MGFVDDNSFECKYVPYLVPDKAKLAYFITEAKGPDRTMAEFAEACGTLSAPSFSRIIHGNLAKSLSVEVIQSIVKNAAPNADISYRRIMRANGMIPEELDSKRRSHEDEDEYQREQELKNKAINVRNIVTDELLARGIMIQLAQTRPFMQFRHEAVPAGKFKLGIPSSFALRVHGYEPLFWVFQYVPSDTYLREEIGQYSDFFLRDLWEPETLTDVKETFVFADKEHFEETREKLNGIKVNNYVELLLVDTNKNTIVEEWMMPRFDGKTMESVFDLPKMDAFPEER